MKSKNDFTISVIIPIMNEEGNIHLVIKRLTESLRDYKKYEIIFIDDGSIDNTLSIIKDFRKKNSAIKYLSFSRNFGHQNALRAGLDIANGDCVISMDGDLQHPPELIPEMIEKWMDGYDVVYTIRNDKTEIGFLKRTTSKYFYKIMNQLSDVKIETGVADFRLLDHRIVEIVRRFEEDPIFYRGIIKWLGFRQHAILYDPNKRSWGVSKYSINKMVKFATLGITSFSVKPLRISGFIGMTIAFLSFIYGLYAIIMKLFTEVTVPGWTSTLIVVSFIGGIQLIILGILGEYIGKLFLETKKRPAYLIKEQELSD